MKLLLDNNLSFKLIKLLKEEFSYISHVGDFNLSKANDDEIWNYAKNNGFIIVTKDSDFFDKSLLYGKPPKVIWLRIQNSSTMNIYKIIKSNIKKIFDFNHSIDESCLIIYEE